MAAAGLEDCGNGQKYNRWGEGRGWKRTSQLPVVDCDEACGGDAGAVEEGGMLEGTRLLDPDVEVVRRVGDLKVFLQCQLGSGGNLGDV